MNYLKYIALLLLSYNSYASEVNLGSVAESNVIIGDNNSIQESNITLKDSGIEAYLDIANSDIYSTGYKEIASNGSNIIFPIAHLYPDDILFKNKKPITSIDSIAYGGSYLENIDYPYFELRLVNNTNKSISIKEFRFDVKNSSAYSSPIIFILSELGSPGYLTIMNEGNTTIEEIDLQYTLKSDRGKKYETSYKYNNSIDSNSFSIDLAEMLKSLNVDIDHLRKQKWGFPDNPLDSKTKAACGIFLDDKKFCHLDIEGSYKIIGRYNKQLTQKTGDFNAKINLTPYAHALGDIPVNPNVFELKLKDNGRNYPITIPASSYIKPFEAEKFIFKAFSNETALHDFKTTITTSDGKVIQSNNKTIFLFAPKSKRENNKKTDAQIFKSKGFDKKDMLNIRHEPGNEGITIGKIPLGGTMSYLKKSTIINKNEWCYVNYNNIYGWINGTFIEKSDK